jgi:hypothetical protein
MRRIALIAVGCVLLMLLLAVGAVALGLHQLNDPASGVSANFTSGFVARCVAASQHGDQPARPGDAQSGDAGDDMTDLCRCGADDMREDLADGGLDGLAHLLLVEGLESRIQRVMDGCQSTPSAP